MLIVNDLALANFAIITYLLGDTCVTVVPPVTTTSTTDSITTDTNVRGTTTMGATKESESDPTLPVTTTKGT